MKLETHPVHLGLGASAVREPALTGMDWYAAYAERHASDGREGRLVSMFTFEQPWDSWEMHPEGHELVLCTSGTLTLVQEVNGAEVRTILSAGEYAINEPGVWHTANCDAPVTALFVTAGLGTQHRPR
jgi:quercetin dioxygenase-like cupin family protein